MKSVTKYLIVVGFAILGSTAMYLYWFFIGCNSGTCLITSSPTFSSGYGLLLGGLVGSSVTDWIGKRKKKQDTI